MGKETQQWEHLVVGPQCRPLLLRSLFVAAILPKGTPWDEKFWIMFFFSKDIYFSCHQQPSCFPEPFNDVKPGKDTPPEPPPQFQPLPLPFIKKKKHT